MAPWGPLNAPLDPLGPPGPPIVRGPNVAADPSFLGQFVLVGVLLQAPIMRGSTKIDKNELCITDTKEYFLSRKIEIFRL